MPRLAIKLYLWKFHFVPCLFTLNTLDLIHFALQKKLDEVNIRVYYHKKFRKFSREIEVRFVMRYARRGFLEILAEILTQLQKNPTRKTLLSYRCKLDSRAVSKYLELMEKIDMAGRSTENQNYFVITKKGKLYLKKYNSLVKPLLR